MSLGGATSNAREPSTLLGMTAGAIPPGWDGELGMASPWPDAVFFFVLRRISRRAIILFRLDPRVEPWVTARGCRAVISLALPRSCIATPVLDHVQRGRSWSADSGSPSADVPLARRLEQIFYTRQGQLVANSRRWSSEVGYRLAADRTDLFAVAMGWNGELGLGNERSPFGCAQSRRSAAVGMMVGDGGRPDRTGNIAPLIGCATVRDKNKK